MYHSFIDENGDKFGSFEVFYEDGYYWWPCSPGCLPNSDATGPFTTEAEAIADAQSI